MPTKLGEDSIVAPSQVIAEPSSLIGDLLSMDLGPGKPTGDAAAAGGNVDLLSGEKFCTIFFFLIKVGTLLFYQIEPLKNGPSLFLPSNLSRDLGFLMDALTGMGHPVPF